MNRQSNENNGMIEFSKDGSVKTTYLRFLSDSAPGFLFILVVVLLYFAVCHESTKHVVVSTDVKIGIMILAFLLATPLGLAINGISWMFLGKWEIYFSQYFMKKIDDDFFLTRPTYSEFVFFYLRDFYLPNLGNNCSEKEERLLCLYKYIKWYEVLLSVYFPVYKNETGYLDGLAQFSRSIAFMAVTLFPCVYILMHLIFCPDSPTGIEKLCSIILNFNFGLILVIGLVVSLFSIVIAGFLEFYLSIKALAYVCALIDPLKLKSITDECRLKEIAQLIVSEGKKQHL